MGFGERIRQIRGSLLQEEFAQKIGVSKSTVGRFEREERTPDMVDIGKILEAYPDINPTWLVTGKEEVLKNDVQEPNIMTSPEWTHPSHNGLFPKEFHPELLLQVTDIINDSTRKRGANIPKDRLTKVTMLAYADAFWRGRNPNKEYIEYLVEVSSFKEGVLSRDRIFIEAASGGLGGGFVVGEQLPELQGWLRGIKVIEVTAEKKDDFGKIENKILRELGVKPDRSPEVRPRQLKASFEKIYQEQEYRYLVVVINDADLLPISALECMKPLHELTIKTGKLPGIVLLGKLDAILPAINSIDEIKQRATMIQGGQLTVWQG